MSGSTGRNQPPLVKVVATIEKGQQPIPLVKGGLSMSEERLDRIEAALDRQAAVNADLRTSVEALKISTTELRVTAEALLQVATIHQQNFERLTVELNADRMEWRSQIDRIWEYLQQQGNGRSEA